MTPNTMPITLQRLLFVLLLSSLSACGFKLRGQVSELPFERVYISAPAGMTIGSELERVISTHTHAQIVKKAKKAEAIIQILYANREKRILSLSEGGKVREFELIYRVAARLLDTENVELASMPEIVLTRILPYLDAQELAKAAEEEMLYKDMQQDAVQQILRQMAAVSVE
ncbi:LPS-assembly lipoprotein LptE [Nitrosomonas stercoris]|uniref:LPS-assembly lipoprotein LptE n=1 Tax=Nitrosomonas stercoris TaxID=1444684 RepID=A0A4Y1YN59_9PROT|nr:LPS-assembly lipoprotein LptE [Nitrosomonas stercoris]